MMTVKKVKQILNGKKQFHNNGIKEKNEIIVF